MTWLAAKLFQAHPIPPIDKFLRDLSGEKEVKPPRPEMTVDQIRAANERARRIYKLVEERARLRDQGGIANS